MTEWHARYGGRGVMIYWHVERRSTCIYSQIKTTSQQFFGTADFDTARYLSGALGQ